jgi:hypothetical protein
VIRDELRRLLHFEERHRRLFARLLLAAAASVVVFLVGTPLVWVTEHGRPGSAIHGLGDAAFFTAAQLLTVSSSMPDPVTSAGEVVDVGLELWAVLVVTALAGSLATFFGSGDAPAAGGD